MTSNGCWQETLIKGANIVSEDFGRIKGSLDFRKLLTFILFHFADPQKRLLTIQFHLTGQAN